MHNANEHLHTKNEIAMRYTLEKYKGPATRHECPRCHDKHSFTYFVDENNEPIDPTCGRCNHEGACQYILTPEEFFSMNPDARKERAKAWKPAKVKLPPPPSYIAPETFEASLHGYADNNFVKYLETIFDERAVVELIKKYRIGTSNHWPGASVFWQIDAGGRVHDGKVMQYDPTTGKRVRKPYDRISWAHSVLKLDDYNLQQCMFGEHLLRGNADTVACVVESEKTAIICSAFIYDAVWVAVGGCQGLTPERCKPLAGRKVILFPDEGKFDDWAKKGRAFFRSCEYVKVADVMELKAKEKGDDIADLLVEKYTTRDDGTFDDGIFRDTMFHTLRD